MADLIKFYVDSGLMPNEVWPLLADKLSASDFAAMWNAAMAALYGI